MMLYSILYTIFFTTDLSQQLIARPTVVKRNAIGKVRAGVWEMREEGMKDNGDRLSIFYYLLYRLPRLVTEGLDDQKLEGVIHKTVLHIQEEKWHNL